MPRAAPTLAWIALAVVASVGWYLTATRLSRIWGLNNAAPAIGLLVAVLVALTLWRWALTDRRERSLAEQRCPGCDTTLQPRHEHARPGGIAVGLARWDCGRCGYSHVEALTCADCAA